MRTWRLFAHSSWDAILVIAGFLHFWLFAWAVLTFDFWSVPTTFLVIAGLALLHLFNLFCVAHNFVHNQYFVSPTLNRLFSWFNSITICMSQQAYNVVHNNHHSLNNDLPKAPGETRDSFSIYRFGAAGKPESVWLYIVRAHTRLNVPDVARKLGRMRLDREARFEWFLVGCFIVACTVMNFWGALLIMAPVQALGWTLAYWESYFEHYGAKPGVREANAVSCYSFLYNLLWFNNGYHMEHHYRPKAHWTQMPKLKEKYEPVFRSHGYRVVKGAHGLGFLAPTVAESETQSPAPEPMESNESTNIRQREATSTRG